MRIRAVFFSLGDKIQKIAASGCCAPLLFQWECTLMLSVYLVCCISFQAMLDNIKHSIVLLQIAKVQLCLFSAVYTLLMYGKRRPSGICSFYFYSNVPDNSTDFLVSDLGITRTMTTRAIHSEALPRTQSWTFLVIIFPYECCCESNPRSSSNTHIATGWATEVSINLLHC